MLKTDFLGYTLKNPLMLTEGPLSGTEELIRQAAAIAENEGLKKYLMWG